ncbi:hypothetical protein AKJ09_03020 [Labilithrix luteola]|uniref:Uncharacterized protein n=1 Tax=Labilithrix luteola TaxID=1391654 RepID=A0A0K1PSL3_9BACT|nr:hypothetical protein [Labilithrix luteola]AKU96356.1 hypothetical protein AKJ09_03020 [Labilithrix luteola]
MSDTPRHIRAERGLTPRTSTLRGEGWLRESPRNYVPRGWENVRHSALRKCLFLPIPKELAAYGANQLPSAPPTYVAPPKALVAPQNVVPHKRNPAKDVRLFPAYDPHHAPHRQATRQSPRESSPHVAGSPPVVVAARKHGAWWEDPIAIGSLLVIAPPIGLAAVWSSRRYGNEARWALTVMTGLMMCLVSAVFVALIVAR